MNFFQVILHFLGCNVEKAIFSDVSRRCPRRIRQRSLSDGSRSGRIRSQQQQSSIADCRGRKPGAVSPADAISAAAAVDGTASSVAGLDRDLFRQSHDAHLSLPFGSGRWYRRPRIDARIAAQQRPALATAETVDRPGEGPGARTGRSGRDGPLSVAAETVAAAGTSFPTHWRLHSSKKKKEAKCWFFSWFLHFFFLMNRR